MKFNFNLCMCFVFLIIPWILVLGYEPNVYQIMILSLTLLIFNFVKFLNDSMDGDLNGKK